MQSDSLTNQLVISVNTQTTQPASSAVLIEKEQPLNPQFSHDGRKQSVWHCYCHKYCSLFLSAFIFSASLSQIICEIVVYPNNNSSAVQIAPRVTIYPLLIFAVVYYVILVFSCGTFKFLWNNMSPSEIYNHIEKITKVKPVIVMRVDLYHFETRIERYTDSNGRTQTRTTIVRVDTYSEIRGFQYGYFRDLSRPFVLEGSSKKYMKLKLANIIFTNDDATKEALQSARNSIRADNRDKDDYMDFSEVWSVAGFKNNILARMESNTLATLFFNMITYLCFSLLLLNVMEGIKVKCELPTEHNPRKVSQPEIGEQEIEPETPPVPFRIRPQNVEIKKDPTQSEQSLPTENATVLQ